MKMQSRRFLFIRTAIAPAFMLIACAFAEAQEHDPKLFLERGRNQLTRAVKWRRAFSADFSAPESIAGCPVPEGAWEVRGGVLRAIGGDRNRTILLAPYTGQPLRIEFEATLHADSLGRLGDITVLIGASPGRSFFSDGYAFTTASYWNTCTTFYRGGSPIARTEYTPVAAEAVNRVAVEFAGGHIRYWLNGAIVLETWEEEPLDLPHGSWIGIRTWATAMDVDNVVVHREK